MNTEMFYTFDENEKPLDRMPSGGGFCGILESVGCIGDSLASGEFESISADGVKGYHDMFYYSWGQFMAREAGFTARNFSRGGMTAKEYLESFGQANGFFDSSLACKAYIIALGVNDILNQHQPTGRFGDSADSGSFAGYFGELVRRYRQISPGAKFFFVTMPKQDAADDALRREHAELMYDFARGYDNSYVIDLYRYAPPYTGQFREKFFLGGHMNPCGYRLTAKFFISYIDYIIRHNMEDFMQMGFIGTDFSYPQKK